MTNFELKQLRKLFFLTTAEAAEHIGGVEPRAWQRWEKGERAIPADVSEHMQMLALTRYERLQREPEISNVAYQYCDSLDSFVAAGGVRNVTMWRLAQSVASELTLEKFAFNQRDSETIGFD